MSHLLIPVLLGVPGILGAILYVIKRLSVFDLELRTHRQQARLRYLAVSNETRGQWQAIYQNALAACTVADGYGKDIEDLERIVRADSVARRLFLTDFARIDPHRVSEGRSGREKGRVRTDVPTCVLALLSIEEAKRYDQEWAAHLHQRVQEGEVREASIDRRRLIRRAIVMAMTKRVRRAGARLRHDR
jgi:hypothetical protein